MRRPYGLAAIDMLWEHPGSNPGGGIYHILGVINIQAFRTTTTMPLPPTLWKSQSTVSPSSTPRYWHIAWGIVVLSEGLPLWALITFVFTILKGYTIC